MYSFHAYYYKTSYKYPPKVRKNKFNPSRTRFHSFELDLFIPDFPRTIRRVWDDLSVLCCKFTGTAERTAFHSTVFLIAFQMCNYFIAELRENLSKCAGQGRQYEILTTIDYSSVDSFAKRWKYYKGYTNNLLLQNQ